MTDHRTKRQKLEAMARQTVSPHEAEVARLKLAAMGDAKAPGYRTEAHEFRFVRPPAPTHSTDDLRTDDLREALRRMSMDDLFNLFQRSTSGNPYGFRRPVPPPCERCRHSHMATVCLLCGPLGPCGSTCMRCRHSQHRGGMCYWCTPLSSEQGGPFEKTRHTGPCAPGYDPNWDAYISGTECPRCHAGHHSPIYCTGTEAQP